MSRRAWIVTSVVGSVLLLGVVALWVAALMQSGRRTFSEVASPDGSWRVAVCGTQMFNGAFEVFVEVRDADGKPVRGGAVIGIQRDGSTIAGKYPIVFVDNESAKVGTMTIEKARYFRAGEEK